SALALVVVLCAVAVVYLLLGAEFMAMIQVIVYAGAIMVLFVLVIMLLNARQKAPTDRSRVARWLGPPLLAAFVLEVLTLVWRAFPANPATVAAPSGGARPIGELLFRGFVLPFGSVSILVLVAVAGAVGFAE